MRTISLCLVATLVATAFAATCQTVLDGALYSAASTCSEYQTCGTTFCSCVGASSTNPNTCMSTVSNTTSCSAVQTCLATYTGCIQKVNSTAAGCGTLATSIKIAHMATTAATYSNSTLQRSCRNRVCGVMNTSAVTCSFGTEDANVCFYRAPATTMAPMTTMMQHTNMTMNGTNASMTTMAPAVTTPGAVQTTAAPTSATPSGFKAAVRATLSFPGNDFGKVLADPAGWARLAEAVKGDLGRFLGVPASFMFIFRMWVGSLNVDFGVDAAAGVQPSVLASKLQDSTALASMQLTSLQSVYSGFSNETLSAPALVAGSISTAAPGSVTPSPAPGQISSSSAGSVAFAAAAVFAAVATAFAF